MTAAHRRTLGFSIKALVLGLITATAVVAIGGMVALQRVSDRYTAEADRAHRLQGEADGLLTAMLNQEVGLRAYLATGERAFLEPVDLGERQERQRLDALRIAATAVADPALVAALETLTAAIDRWHREIEDPQIRDRGEGIAGDLATKLRAGKGVFDALRDQHTQLLAGLEARASGAQASRDTLVHRIQLALFALVGLGLVLAAIAAGRISRAITQPLNALVGRAERQEGFAPPSDDEPVHEVHALATALHRLDLQVARREDELAAAHGDALALTQFGEFAQQLSSEDELYAAVERVCRATVQPSKLTILVRNASKNRLDIARSTAPYDRALRLPILTEPMKCRAVRTLRDVRANSDSPTACSCTLGVPLHGSMLCVPMLAAGELVGVVNLQSHDRDHFDERRARSLHGYFGFAGGTISSLQLIAATRERALRDSLTGAHNRAFLSEYLPKTLAAASRRGSKVAVVMADLDHFKRINDEYGHPVGDQAITEFARCAQQQIRASDALVRYGGEEFAIVLTDVTLDGALATAERIRRAVADLALSAGGIDLGNLVRVSQGVALFPEHGDSLQALVAVADAALYAAKQQGRDRVVLGQLRTLSGDSSTTTSTCSDSTSAPPTEA